MGSALVYVLVVGVVAAVIYVATALYMGGFAWWIGRYKIWWVALILVAFPLVIFVAFEVGFRVSLPKSVLYGRPHVIIENLGDEVYTVTADRNLLRLEGTEAPLQQLARFLSALFGGLAAADDDDQPLPVLHGGADEPVT